eukprot:7728741-Pyramimonas_sp.AAC.1
MAARWGPDGCCGGSGEPAGLENFGCGGKSMSKMSRPRRLVDGTSWAGAGGLGDSLAGHDAGWYVSPSLMSWAPVVFSKASFCSTVMRATLSKSAWSPSVAAAGSCGGFSATPSSG